MHDGIAMSPHTSSDLTHARRFTRDRTHAPLKIERTFLDVHFFIDIMNA